jgi:hypothetical protein
MSSPRTIRAGGADNRQPNVVAHNRESLAHVRDDAKTVTGKRALAPDRRGKKHFVHVPEMGSSRALPSLATVIHSSRGSTCGDEVGGQQGRKAQEEFP